MEQVEDDEDLKPWGVYITRKFGPRVVHIIPEEDLIEHEGSEWCPCCQVTIEAEDDENIMYVHAALDKRPN